MANPVGKRIKLWDQTPQGLQRLKVLFHHIDGSRGMPAIRQRTAGGYRQVVRGSDDIVTLVVVTGSLKEQSEID